MKQKPAELEGGIRQYHNNRYFNTPFSATDRKTGGEGNQEKHQRSE